MILTAIVFLVILTVLVLIHELGHYTAARIIGVKVEEFGLGLPPRAAGKKIGDTIYSLNWLPIGGFVRLAGEDPEEVGQMTGAKNSKQYFWGRSKKERAIILTAGVIMNFVLAVVITGGLLVHGVEEPSGTVHIVTVTAKTPAAAAGIQVGDIVKSVSYVPAGKTITVKTTDDLISFSHEYAGKPLTVTLSRNGHLLTVPLTPRTVVPKGQGPMGIAISDLEMHRYGLWTAANKAVVINVLRARDMLGSLWTVVARLATLRKPQAEIAGPIGIAEVTGQAVKFGWAAVFEFASILSLNLAVLNILPIPALDGGRLLFVLLEKIFRKRVNPVFERNAHQIGMIILLVLIFLVSINDILRLARGG